MRSSTALSALLLTVLACESGTQNSRTQPRVSMVRIDASSTLLLSAFSGFRDPQQTVVRDQDAWQQAWTVAHAAMEPAPPVPAVDFGAETVLLVAMGTASSGGHAISIDSMDASGTSQVIYLTRTTPGPTCMTAAVITNPVHIVKVPGQASQVTWREATKTLAC